MSEYLAPAVYVEEVDTGSKPIEGVSTSTAGMIGITERGPVDVPILVTSAGDYRRWFGEGLNPRNYAGKDDNALHYLPHAVQGFFSNGGKRLYVNRVLNRQTATAASRTLVAAPAAGAAESILLRGAAPGDTVVIVANAADMAVRSTVLVGSGANSEVRRITSLAPARSVALDLPLSLSHRAVVNIEPASLGTNRNVLGNLRADAERGATEIQLNSDATIPVGALLAIGTRPSEELVVVREPVANSKIVPLQQPLLLPHDQSATVTDLDLQTTTTTTATQVALVGDYLAGESVLIVAGTSTLPSDDDVIRIYSATGDEYRRVGTLIRVPLATPAYADLPSGTLAEGFTLPPPPTPTVQLIGDAPVGATIIHVSDRASLADGSLIAVGSGDQTEYLTVAASPEPHGTPDRGAVVLAAPLRRPHPADTPGTHSVAHVPVPQGPQARTLLAADARQNDDSLLLVAPPPPTFTGIILLRLTLPSGETLFHAVNASALTTITPTTLTLAQLLQGSHPPYSMIALRDPTLEVRALDAGQWGNRLRVALERQDPPNHAPLLTTTVRSILPGNRLRLNSAAGVESGSELMLTDTAGGTVHLKVADIDRQNDFLITLHPNTPLPASAAAGDDVRSVEYRFVVDLLRQPDPASPSRNNVAIDRELFTGLSLDPHHSRYIQRVVGSVWDLTNTRAALDDGGRPLRRGDRRSEGESAYVRIRDLAPTTDLRQGPQADYEQRPGLPPRLILLPLGGGDDSLAQLQAGEATFIGVDDPNPDLRTGLQALRNIEEISIIAAPGRTSAVLQGALINHCELMRYRFVALDGPPPPNDTMAGVQFQRQQFDTKYAALYHPWLLVADPYPLTSAGLADVPMPPSGHVLGIYARTDIERGVHKAPANEVVRGVTGLRRTLNKEQQDILNPYPVNINVIRDFRPHNRGIRVYGGRCITSDSDWKYVNVRRLLIFIEASIDRGLQWCVFEPNAEPLWARVKRSVENFLELVRRNGGLEGTRSEQAYFVRCDRSTMTQTDIDQGRLICLVGVAPVKPAEFVIVRIGLWTAHADV